MAAGRGTLSEPARNFRVFGRRRLGLESLQHRVEEAARAEANRIVGGKAGLGLGLGDRGPRGALVVEGAQRGDLLWIEGQGALLHPLYSGVTLGLMHGSVPHVYVLCHEAGRTEIEGVDAHHPIPPLSELVELHERISLPVRPARVVAVAVNTRFLDEEAARAAVAEAQEETGLPADDPVRFGAGRLLDAVLDGLDA